MYGSLASSSSSSSSSSPYQSEKLLPPGASATGFGSPRRAFSLPSITVVPFSSSSTKNMGLGLGSPILPLPGGHSPGRSTARRLSYSIKNRASHYALPLTVGGLFTMAFFIFVSLRGSTEVRQFNNANRLHVYGRGSSFSDEEHQHRVHLPDSESDNGVSLLLVDEEELIAEDDLFWDSYTDPEPKSAEEEAAEAELLAHRQDVIAHDKEHSLRALVWWLAEGGIIPSSWEVPSKQYLRKIGGRGVERLLQDIDGGEEGAEIFENGWADFAKKRYRIVVFSKTHCPYSKRAKSILGEYRLSPAPFIIELDHRSDMDKLQTLLQRLTGRRTVPNVLLDATSIGGADDITLFHAEGGLQRRFEEMEVVPGSRRRRVKKPVQKPETAEAGAPVALPGQAQAVPLDAPVAVQAADAGSESGSTDTSETGTGESSSSSTTSEDEGEDEHPAKRVRLDLDADEWDEAPPPRARGDYNGRVLV